MLGSGRVNTFRMLNEENVQPFLKIEMLDFSTEDENGNNINEPGELISLDMDLYNYMPCYGANEVMITLSTDDPEIRIIDGSGMVNILPDSSFHIVDQFQFQVGESAHSHFALMTLSFEAGVPITMGQQINLEILVAPSGIFIYEGEENTSDYSGTFIRDYLQENGYTSTYRSILSEDLKGIDAAFLSFGNFGSGYTALNTEMSTAIVDYLQNGGKVYLESSDAMGYDQPGNTLLLNLFGLFSAADGTENNPIDNLSGKPAALTHDMVFYSNSQDSNAWIDKYVLFPDAINAFTESDYGIVAAQHTGENGCKTFCFSYALAKLDDGEFPSTREELLQWIIDFFDLTAAITESSVVSRRSSVVSNRLSQSNNRSNRVSNFQFRFSAGKFEDIKRSRPGSRIGAGWQVVR